MVPCSRSMSFPNDGIVSRRARLPLDERGDGRAVRLLALTDEPRSCFQKRSNLLEISKWVQQREKKTYSDRDFELEESLERVDLTPNMQSTKSNTRT